jgi:hypothetical protein
MTLTKAHHEVTALVQQPLREQARRRSLVPERDREAPSPIAEAVVPSLGMNWS